MMYKLDVNLEDRKRQIKVMFDAGLISPDMYHDLFRDIINEEQVGILEYHATDETISNYYS